jgi:site-specific DNA-methyltransferase (adenine-specific)
MCLRLHGLQRTRLVADPFLGLGSTAVACAELGVNFIGVEMDQDYLEQAIDRTRAAVPPAAIRPEGVKRVERVGRAR